MKIILACGGTGGHIFPAFSVAEELKHRDPLTRLIYVCGHRDIENAIFKIVASETVIPIESAPYRGLSSLLSLAFLLKLIKGFWQSFRLVAREKPDLIAGFGGYYSFPVTFIGRCLGVRTLIHEQNVIPGKANKVLAKFADAVALSFPETRNYLAVDHRSRVTGNPIRSLIEKDCRREALDFFGFSEEKRTLLVLGGSQGAESINSLFLGALKFFPERLKETTQILHLCGKMAVATSEEAFRKAGIRGKTYSFFERMDLVYAVADMAIGRAGATFLAEIGVKNIPAILVPYPHGDGHQLVNAEIFSQTHAAVVIRQEGLTPLILSEALENFLKEENQVPKSKANAADPARTLFVNFIQEAMR